MIQPEITWHFSEAPIQPNVSTKVMSAYRKSSLYVRIHNQKTNKLYATVGGKDYNIIHGQSKWEANLQSCVVQYPNYDNNYFAFSILSTTTP